MAGGANLSDPRVIRDFRGSQMRFNQQVEATVDCAPTRLSRTQERLRLELGPYWKRELSKRQDAFAEARRKWLDAESDVRANGRRGAIDKGSSIDERREMLKAQRRCEEAEAKIEAVKTWLARLDGDGKDLVARVRNHQLALQDLGKGAVARLDHLAEQVEEYLRLQGGGS